MTGENVKDVSEEMTRKERIDRLIKDTATRLNHSTEALKELRKQIHEEGERAIAEIRQVNQDWLDAIDHTLGTSNKAPSVCRESNSIITFLKGIYAKLRNT